MGKSIYNIEKILPSLPNESKLSSLPSDGGDKWNRLVFEASPYLLQHAANPVDWYSWSPEAFSKAKAENKPIMLSIGYSTCHWCHVMEKESFEDEEVAKALNEDFVCIKVDREERPDIDNLYMNIANSMLGRGGWPLNVFLTPDKEVFHAATYVPKYSRQTPAGTMPGMLDLIPHLGKVWQEDKDQILDSAKNIMKHFSFDSSDKAAAERNGQALLNQKEMEALSDQCFAQLNSRFDRKHGGFGAMPKFPSPHTLSFLLKYHMRTANAEALFAVKKTLKHMRLGGIFDQVGLGFHRYSTDRQWVLPHFEKMLYDQAMLMMAYAHCYQITQNDFYKNVVSEIFDYLTNDMLSENNLFYSAEDADSEGEEGLFYTWTYQELEKALGKKDLEKLSTLYHLNPQGNFNDEATREPSERNIFYLDIEDEEMIHDKFVQSCLAKLNKLREKRIHPLKDDKVLTDWNSMVIAAMAIAYDCTKDEKYLEQAKLSLASLKKQMLDERYYLKKSLRGNKVSKNKASLGDYSYFVWALIELFKVTCDEEHIKLAMTMTKAILERFFDEDDASFFYSDKESSDLPINSKDFHDGAVPSANSVMLSNLLFLYQYSGENTMKDIFYKLAARIYEQAQEFPSAYAHFMTVLETSFEPFNLSCKTK